MNLDTMLCTIALGVSAVAVVTDIRKRRIPNWLTYPAIVGGLVLRGTLGWKGLFGALAGCLVAGGVFLLFYMVRAMGAGDMKLAVALGSLLGPTDACVMLLATAISGGVLAIVYSLYRGRIRSTVMNVGAALRFHAAVGLEVHPELNLDNPATLRMPYALAIATGTLYVYLTTCWR